MKRISDMKISPKRFSYLKDVKRLVIKIGSKVLSSRGGLDTKNMNHLIAEIVRLHQHGKEIIIVSSGAIVAGMKELGLSSRPKNLPLKQAAAAIGQSKLIQMYEELFRKHRIKVAQILLTREDMAERRRFLNSRNTILKLLSYRIIPVVNENDTVSVDEIKFGDNDFLSALVASLIDADILLILSDVDGLFTADPAVDPDATLVSVVEKIDKSIEVLASDSISIEGTGGMISKVESARKASEYGIPAIIINGRSPGLLFKALEGYEVGTFFLPDKSPLPRKKHWILHSIPVRGRLVIDNGAREALLKSGKSLLPAGILSVKGEFDTGEAVICSDKSGKDIAKGLVNYSSREIDRIKGKKTGEIASILGFKDYDEVIHRDNMVVFN